MPTEIFVLGLACLLVLFHVIVVGIPRIQVYGAKYAAGPRDEDHPPPTLFAQRATRASANMLETFPAFAALALALVATGKTGGMGEAGAELYIVARTIYWPLYVTGVQLWRSVAWFAAIGGIVMMALRLFFG